MLLKRILSYGVPFALAAGLTMPALGDETPRFSTDGFLSEWKAFLKDEEKAAEKEKVPGNLDFNVGDASKGDTTDFIFFKKPEETSSDAPVLRLSTSVYNSSSFAPVTSLVPDNVGNSLLTGDAWLLNSFTPRYPTAHLRLGFGGAPGGSKFDLALTSRIITSPAESFGPDGTGYLSGSLARRAYNLGIGASYSGFRVGAALRGEEGAYFDGISGYDVGVSYSHASWSTSLLFSEYRNANNYLFGVNGPLTGGTYFALEFGAAYRLNPWLKFVGAVRYYEDPNMLLLDPNGLTISHLFYLGTNVNF